MGSEQDPTLWEDRRAKTREEIPPMPPSEADGLPVPEGTSFGRYQNIEVLARGGVGQVLKAFDPEIGREVAIKILRPDRETDRILIEKFRREAHITGRLDHPNIIPIHDMGRMADGALYFIMKLSTGQSLAEMIRNLRRNPHREKMPHDGVGLIGHFQKVCDAMAYSHSQRIVHRDLKPANIMIGEYGEVLVVDWGLAKFLDTEEESSVLMSGPGKERLRYQNTPEGVVMGTMRYMSPEQAEGRVGSIDERSDIYTLGVILYELLTLEAPFQGQGWQVIGPRIVDGRFSPPSHWSRVATVPRELEAVVLKAMALDPADRYATVLDLQFDIQAFLDGRVLVAADYSPFQRLRKKATRHRVSLGVGGTVLAMAGILFGGMVWKESHTRSQRFDLAIGEAKRILDRVGSVEKWVAVRPVVDAQTGFEHRESPEEYEGRKRAIEEYLLSMGALDRALGVRPELKSVRQERRELGRTLGEMALQGRDYLLARQVFMQLQGYGVDPEEVARLLQRVEEKEQALSNWRARRLNEILADLRAGLGRSGRSSDAPMLADLVFEAVGYRDVQTVEMLAADLMSLVEKSKQNRKAGGKVIWSQSERDRAIWICRVLGRLGLPGCVLPLGAWMDVLIDHQLATEAGLALCHTRRAEAHPYLVRARVRLGDESVTWRQIARFFNRIPTPEVVGEVAGVQREIERGQIHEEKKEFEQAIAAYTRAIHEDSRLAEPYARRGIVYSKVRRYPEAIRDLTQAIRIDPRHPQPYVNRATICFLLGRYPKALEDISKATWIAPNLVDAVRTQGNIYLAMGQYERAVQNFTRAIELAPKDSFNYVNRAMALESLRRFPEALADLSKGLRLDPENAKGFLNRGRIYLLMNRLEDAVTDFSRALQIDPRMGIAYESRGAAFFQMQRYEEALVDFDQQFELDPASVSACNHRGKCFMALKRYEEASEAFSEAMRIDSEHASSYANRGHLRTLLKQYPEALSDLSRAIELDPENATPLGMRGQLYVELRRISEAIADFSRIIQLDPSHPHAYLSRGDLYRSSKRFPEALADYSRVIELDPKLAQGYANRGMILQALKRYSEALKDFGRALDLSPRFAEVYMSRGLVYAYEKRFEEALRDFGKAIDLKPTIPVFYWNRGLTYVKLGRSDEACADYRTFLQLNPDAPQRSQIEAYLQKHSR